MKFSMKLIGVAGYVILGTACGGGGENAGRIVTTGPLGPRVSIDGPGSNFAAEPGEGIWQGAMVSNVSGESSPIVALIDGWGWMTLVSENGQFLGAIQRQDNSTDHADITVDVTGIAAAGFSWPDGSTTTEFSLSGAISPPTEINANYSGGGDNGTISMLFDPASDRPLSVGRANGMWVRRDASQNITAVFEITRRSINGTDADGCIYEGTMMSDTWFSVYIFDVSLTASNCPLLLGIDLNGEYVGPAGVTDMEPGSGQDDKLIIAVSNDEHVITLALDRN